MNRPSIATKALGYAASIAALVARGDRNELLREQRSYADSVPKANRNRSVYIPAGKYCNTRGTYVKNSLIGAQMNKMHDMWIEAKEIREGVRYAVSPVTS